VIKPEGHGLNVEITHINNVEDKHIVSVRQLKIAKLKPEQIGDIISNKEMKMEIKMEKNKDEVNQHEIHNLKRRNIYTQARRAGKTKKVKETREEWEVQDIVNERKNKKTGLMEYEIKWVGWPKTTWQTEEDLTNALEILEKWKAKRKMRQKKGKMINKKRKR